VTAKTAAKMYADGTLQPEFLAVRMWVEALVRDYRGNQHVIFDGTPRKVHEAGVLDSVFEFYGLEKPCVLHIDVSRGAATERLSGRGRLDDTRGDIENRMNWYETDVEPTISFYEKNQKYSFIRVNGEQSVEEVFAEIVEKTGI
jgi:adenylate kinase